MIRDMAGCNNNGKLSVLDLRTSIVSGGDAYWSTYKTEDDKLGDYAFAKCKNLTSVSLPQSITSIGIWAFYDCSNLTTITFPSQCKVSSIGMNAFYGCTNLSNITLPSGVTSIGNGAFSDCSSLTSLVIPEGVTSIGENTFYGCSSLKSVTIPSGVTSIGSSAFRGCSSLTGIAIPSGVTSISEYTFAGCSSLTSITLPSGVTAIGGRAFSGCSSLKSIYVSAETPVELGVNVFGDMDMASCTLYVPIGAAQNYKSAEGWGGFANVEEYDVTGIDHQTGNAETKETARYSANGQRLDVPTKGLNIVKYSDGSVKKVMVQ